MTISILMTLLNFFKALSCTTYSLFSGIQCFFLSVSSLGTTISCNLSWYIDASMHFKASTYLFALLKLTSWATGTTTRWSFQFSGHVLWRVWCFEIFHDHCIHFCLPFPTRMSLLQTRPSSFRTTPFSKITRIHLEIDFPKRAFLLISFLTSSFCS